MSSLSDRIELLENDLEYIAEALRAGMDYIESL